MAEPVIILGCQDNNVVKILTNWATRFNFVNIHFGFRFAPRFFPCLEDVLMRKFNVLLIFVLLAGLAAMAYAEGIPEKITIDGCAKKKAAVVFPHKAHFEVTKCETCHHKSKGLTAENFAEMDIKACAVCHLNPEKADTPNCSKSSKKLNPFHLRCVKCHKETKAKDAATKAPTKCKQCHPKPKKS